MWSGDGAGLAGRRTEELQGGDKLACGEVIGFAGVVLLVERRMGAAGAEVLDDGVEGVEVERHPC